MNLSRFEGLKWSQIIAGSLLIGSVLAIGNFIERYETILLLATYLTAFGAYVMLALKEEGHFNLLFSIGTLSRLVLFFSMPSLSDDVYRFIWDGTLLKNGIHPFEQLPTYYLRQNVAGLDQALYDHLNSPHYFTIYPPINQFIFWLAVVIGNGNVLASTNVIRGLLLLADIGAFVVLRKLLVRYNKPARYAFWFFLNPLVILEFTGNLHFEGLVIFFLLTGVYFFERAVNQRAGIKNKWFSGTAIGLAIGTKLLPYIFLPYFFFKGLKGRTWLIGIIAGMVSVVTLIPLVNEPFIQGMKSSLDLYFRKFEFNASIYFIARKIGFGIYGYNNIAKIGPFLSIVSLIGILTLSLVGAYKKWAVPKVLLFILCIYLCLTTTVHPWYIIQLVAFGILSGYLFPVVWSLMVFITYLGYSQNGFELPMSYVMVEYLVVLVVFLVEMKGCSFLKRT